MNLSWTFHWLFWVLSFGLLLVLFTQVVLMSFLDWKCSECIADSCAQHSFIYIITTQFPLSTKRRVSSKHKNQVCLTSLLMGPINSVSGINCILSLSSCLTDPYKLSFTFPGTKSSQPPTTRLILWGKIITSPFPLFDVFNVPWPQLSLTALLHSVAGSLSLLERLRGRGWGFFLSLAEHCRAIACIKLGVLAGQRARERAVEICKPTVPPQHLHNVLVWSTETTLVTKGTRLPQKRGMSEKGGAGEFSCPCLHFS